MHKQFDFELSIENYDIEKKSKLQLILEVLNKYDGLLTDNSDSAIFFGFETQSNQLDAHSALYKIGICSDIWIEGVKK